MQQAFDRKEHKLVEMVGQREREMTLAALLGRRTQAVGSSGALL